MKSFKHIFIASIGLLSMTACSANNGLSISNKEFTYNSFAEISVDEGLYGSEDGFIGVNKDELAAKVIQAVVVPGTNTLKVSGTPISGHKYNGQDVKVYAVSEYTSDGISSFKCNALATSTADEFRFLKNVGGSLDLENLTYSLGYREQTSGYVTTTYVATVTYEVFKYNKSEGTLSANVMVKDSKTIDDETTTKSGTFTLTFKA